VCLQVCLRVGAAIPSPRSNLWRFAVRKKLDLVRKFVVPGLELMEIPNTGAFQFTRGGSQLTERELSRGAARRLAIIQHVEEVTGNVAMTCRYFGILRHTYYFWLRR
jgi:hypothetical protein